MYVRTGEAFGHSALPQAGPRLGLPDPGAPRVLTYSTRDVIDARISVPAQHSLVRLSKNAGTSADAVAILDAVKTGRLAGIYCVNWREPARRALPFEASWWTVIPPGEDAALILDPDNLSGGSPLIAFRRELDPRGKHGCGRLKTDTTLTPSPARLDAALLKAWVSYTLWHTGRLALCGQAPDRPVPNVVPRTLCQTASPVCPSPPTSSRAFTQWVQASLNRILGVRLPVSGIFDAGTRSALRSFQQRRGFIPNAQVDRATQEALVVAAELPVPCQTGGSTPATSGRWSEDLLNIWLLSPRAKRGCLGRATPTTLELFSACDEPKACALPKGDFEFIVHFVVDDVAAAIPVYLMMPTVSVDMEFTTDGGRPIFSRHVRDNSPKYAGAGAPMLTSFGQDFAFSSRESGRLAIRLRAEAVWPAGIVTARYTDTVRCRVIKCA